MKNLRVSLPVVAIGLSLFLSQTDTALAQTSPLSAAPLTVTAQTGNAVGQFPLNVTSSTPPTSFIAPATSTNGWFAIAPTVGFANPTTTLTLTIVSSTVNLLASGQYTDTVTLTPQNGTAATATIALNLTPTGSGGGSLTASPAALTFALATSGQIASQPVTISTSGAATTVTPLVGSLPSWLSVTPATAQTTNATFNVVANSTGLANNTYSSSVTFNGTNGGSVSVGVTLTVGSTTVGILTATPNPLNITIPVGSTTPSNQTLSVTTASGTVTFTTAATTIPAGQTWLSVNPFTQIVTSPGTAQLNVSINPFGLSVGNYSGSITLTPQGGGTATTVPVNLTISGAPAFTVSPTSMMFSYQTGTAFPAAQPLMIGSTGQSIAFGVIVSTVTGGSWLVVNPQGSTTPVNLSISVNPSGLPAGTYIGNIQLVSAGASNSPVNVQVTLLVSTQPIVAFSNSGTLFNYQTFSATLPPSQTVQVTSSGNPLPFTVSTTPVSGGNFLTVTPSTGTTPQPLTFALNQAVVSLLAPGTYTETVTVTAPTAGNNPQNYTVTLVVTQNTLLNANQSALNFNYELGQAQPAAQTLNITSSGAPLNYTVAASTTTCGNSWLTATPASGTTNGSIAVSVNTTGLVAGNCTGAITITSGTAGNTLNIPVTLYVSSTALLNVSPSAINIQSQVGTNPTNISVALTSTDPVTQLPFTVTSTTNQGGVNWLLVGPTSGTTPANLTAGFNTAGLPVGTYTGSITIAATGPANTPVVIPVQVTVTSSATISTAPAALTFTQSFNGSAPASQSLTVNTSTPGQTFATSATVFTPAGGNWLSVTPSGGITSGAVTVTANGAGLAQGTYSGVVTIVVPGAANTPFNVPVTLVVGPAQSLVVGSNSLTFTYQQGATTSPAAQNVQLTSTGGNVSFTATPSLTNGVSVFTVTPSSGTTPATLSVGVSQAALANLVPGQPYSGTITVASPSIPGGNLVINVNLTVTAPAPPSVGTVVNSASNQPGAIAPGEIITIYGTNIGPTPAVGLQLTAAGLVSSTLGNTQVTFDGFAAPLIFVSSGQINAIIPYEIAGRATVAMLVQRNGQTSMSVQLQVTNSSPGIFTTSQGGNGQGAILNQNQSVNSSANPATKGSVIVIYATGEGRPTPIPATGSVTGTTSPFPMVSNVTVTIGGQPAQILYAGEAPGLVSGALQVNAVVPTSIVGSGPQTVQLSIGGNSNNLQNVTVAVQ